MPAYNAERTIASSIDSLLAQTFSDFELIISDNASTDGTWAMVEDYMRRDARVRGIRQSENIGANGNYSAVFKPSRGRYFKWASSNDWCAPEFLARCVSRLDADSGIVLVAPRTRLFESSIAEYTDYEGDIACTQPNPVDRFIHVDTQLALNNVLNGLIRTDGLRRTRLIEHYRNADVVLVGHLALLGRIELLDEPMFYRRMDRATATRLMSADAVHRHHYPVKTARSLFPAWRLAMGWARAAMSAPLRFGDTLRAMGWVLRRAYWNKAEMRGDIVDVLRFPMGQ
jgi:glycosyltransferase involved in cell wall biosynthesis